MFYRKPNRLYMFAIRIVSLCAIAASIPALAVTFTTIDFPGAASTQVYGINNSGVMVGVYVDTQNVTHGFLLQNGAFTTIDYPGATLSVAAGINNNGQIVGQYNDKAGFGHGFLLKSGKFRKVDFAPYQTFPTAIGDAGEIVGFCVDSQFAYHGCVRAGGVFSLLDVPGSKATVVLGINLSQGKIVGGFGTTDGFTFQHGFVYKNGKFADVDFPGAAATVAFGIDDQSKIVGSFSLLHSSRNHGFVDSSGTFVKRDFPAARSTSPINLNNRGTVVGWYEDKSKVQHGYVMRGGF